MPLGSGATGDTSDIALRSSSHSERDDTGITSTTDDGVNVTEVSAPLSVRVDNGEDTTPQPQPTGPKTWANVIGGSNYSSKPPVQQIQPAVVDATPMPQQAPLTANNNNNNNNNSNSSDKYGEEHTCRLYLGSIGRNRLPSDTETPEREIRRIFERKICYNLSGVISFRLEFGPVDQVNMPRKTIDVSEPNKFAFAFIVMKTVDGAKNAYAACRQVCVFVR